MSEENKLRLNWDEVSHYLNEFVTYKDKLFTGVVYEEYPNGNLMSETGFVNGLISGWSREWYENGQLKEEEYYRRLILDGVSREWYESGQLKKREKVEKAICVEREVWNEKGVLIEHFHISEKDTWFDSLQERKKRRQEWLDDIAEWESEPMTIEDLKKLSKEREESQKK